MAKDATTAREAMVGQMMEDFDALVRRLEQVDGELAAKIAEAVRDGSGRALLQSQMNFESMMEKERNALVLAGRETVARIGNEINRSSANLLTTQAERRALGFCALLIGSGMVIGALLMVVGHLAGLFG